MISDAEVFDYFQQRIKTELLNHNVIHTNKYCRAFAEGTIDIDDVRYLTQQFSIFSNQFIIAQLKKVLNAPTLEEMHDGKEILMNELGVVFKDGSGSIENSVFRFKAAHFEWLIKFAEPLGFSFADLGRRSLAFPSTLFFCDELIRIYGSEDYVEAAGASYAVENWAAAGFWKQLIQGLEYFSEESGIKLHLSFFKSHDLLEAQHAQHTQDELKEIYFTKEFNEDKFIKAGNEMLNGVEAFWHGLYQDRITRYWQKTRG